MRIAQISPLYESVPPKLYGGTERVVSYLTEELVRLGHTVTLFASGDSRTQARLCAASSEALRLTRCIDPLAHHVVMLERVFQQAEQFDILHFHCDYMHFPLSRRQKTAQVTTLHGRLDLPDLVAVYREFTDMPVISISDAQRKPLPWLNWQGTVHHGLPPGLYDFHPNKGEYLAFLGRICPEKGVDRAIEIAKRAGVELRIAAKVDRVDEQYFGEHIRPLLDHPLIHYVGEITDSEKNDFLGRALALLFPIDWPEPFGLTMIESLACGTPVIAFPRGSVPEVLANFEAEAIVQTVNDAVALIRNLRLPSRKRCRSVFQKRFTVSRMAQDYLAIYDRLITEKRLRRERLASEIELPTVATVQVESETASFSKSPAISHSSSRAERPA